MDKINTIVDREGDFWIWQTNRKVPGVLFFDAGRVKLRIMHKNTRHRVVVPFMSDEDSEPAIYGNVAGMKVVLTRCIKMSSGGGLEWSEEIIEPDLILFGYGEINHTQIKQISYNAPCLYYFFSEHLIECGLERKSGYIYKVDEEKIGEALSATDTQGELRINRGVTYHPFANIIKQVGEDTSIDYTFFDEVEIHEAIRKIAQARNLFLFLCGSHIPIDNVKVTFEGNSFSVWFNYSDDVDMIEDYHFLIRSHQVIDIFESIWREWVTFSETNIYFVELFFEICCNRSKSINQFNNLCQMLEMYSRKYRDAKAKAIARVAFYNDTKNANKRFKHSNIYLSHRLEDIFLFVANTFLIPEEKVSDCALKVADTRNFYTHYDRDNQRYSEMELFFVNRVLKRFCEVIVINQCVGNVEMLSEKDIYGRDLYPEDVKHCFLL